jgi:molybdate transport system ATP-binding protein
VTLDADFAVTVGDLELAVGLEAPAGQTTAVLGPNGAGKTTLLRSIAGALAVDRGTITLDGVLLDGPPATFVRPEHRRIGVVHQDLLLFPHLSVLDNVAFGLRCGGMRRSEARRRASGILDGMGMSGHASERPAALSGGQAQRVALARALAGDPRLLVLDEPMGPLDPRSRVTVRRDLRQRFAELDLPCLLVTHDPVDVLALADRVAVLEAGRIGQVGTVAEVVSRPRSPYVADLIGTNLVTGSSTGTTITTSTGATVTTAEAHHGEVFATIPPNSVVLHRSVADGSARNRWPVTVGSIDHLGERVRVELVGPLELTAEITRAACDALELREGDRIWASVKATQVSAYER